MGNGEGQNGQTEMEGEAEVRGEPKKVPQPDCEAMKETFRAKRYELQDHTTPAKSGDGKAVGHD